MSTTTAVKRYRIYPGSLAPRLDAFPSREFDTIPEAEKYYADMLAATLEATGKTERYLLINHGTPTRSYSKCSKCGNFDTITYTQEAWADVYECKHDGCGYYYRYSIGD